MERKKWPEKEPKLRNALGQTGTYAALILFGFLIVFPFIWMFSTAITPGNEVFAWPPRLIPSRAAWGNFREAIVQYRFGGYMVNTLIVACISTASSVFFNALAGYTFGKLKFPGRDLLFFLVLASIMIPLQITMVPVFIMFKNMPLAGGNNLFGAGGTGLIDTLTSLVLPGLATTFGTYLAKEHFAALPWELLDSGRIDGLSEGQIFWKIYLPLAKPVLATVAIFSFTETWNNFVWPLVMTSSPEKRTVQLALSGMKGQYFSDWHLLMAATIFTALPCFIVYLIGQKQFTQGVAMTGLKE